MCVCACVRLLPVPVCFANWTGIVVEVKRGQLKDGEGSAEKECCWGGVGWWCVCVGGDLREQQFLTSKGGLESGQILNPLTDHCKTTHSTFTYSGSLASHEMNIHPCRTAPSLLLSLSLPPLSLCVSRSLLRYQSGWAFRGKY